MADSQNTVVIDDVGPARKRLTITIPESVIDERLENSLITLMGEAELPGFRRGRAPRRLIEKRFGGAINSETKNQLIASAYSEAIETNKIQVLGEPDDGGALEDLKLEAGKPLTFSVEIEVPPDFELPSLDGMEVLKPVIEVDDDMVNDQIEKFAVNDGSLEAQDEGGPGDYCIGHGVMKDKGGEVLIDLEGAVIQIPAKDSDGKGAILGVMVDDFAKQIGKPKPGDTLKVKCVGPEGHENESVRGKDLEIEYEVERVERIIPASTEQLMARYGMSSEEELRENVTLRLNHRVLLEQQNSMRHQVAANLIDAVQMELPERVTEHQVARNLQRKRFELMHMGVNEQEIENHLAELRTNSQEAAVRELKMFFILARVAEKFEIKLTEEEVQAHLTSMAMERGVRPDQLQKELVESNQIGMVVQQLREHKALDAVLAQADVKELSSEEFNKVMEEKAEARKKS